jgi:histidinol dehydrogenase
MIQFMELSKLTSAELARLMKRAETDIQQLFPLAQDVINQVQAEGDAAVVMFDRQFDAKYFEASMFKAT